MQQIRITRTADLNGVLSFLKERYPLLSEAEIVKMALSNQYYQEAARKDRKEVDEVPNEYFKQAIKEGRAARKQGKASPIFNTAEEMIAWLHKQGV